MTAVYIDSTHTKAYANKKKNHKEAVKIEAKKYQKELDLEIALKGLQEEDLSDEEYLEEVEKIIKCNEEVNIEEVIGEKEIIVSDTDKDAGMLYKSDKEKMFGYNTSVICENNNYVLTVDTNEYRYREDVKEIYRQRPQHIERVFADGKMKYGLRNTYYRTKERVHRELTLLYACMNLKKFALHHYV